MNWLQYFRFLSDIFNSSTFIVLIIMFIIDTLTGVLLAVVRKSNNTVNGALESRQLLKGFYKKMAMILICLLSTTISFLTNENVVVYLTFAVFIGHEGLSVLENLALLKVPFPDKLKKMLEVLYKKKGDGDSDGK